MSRFENGSVTILRLAGPNDAGYDALVPKVWIRPEDGGEERLVLRADVDETEDMTDKERKAMEAAVQKTPDEAKADEARREAHARGVPPDQTPDPTIRTVTGRDIPNPDALSNNGQAPVLEQEKQAVPTVANRHQPGAAPQQDRGDPRQGAYPAPDEAGAAKPENAPDKTNAAAAPPQGTPEGLGEDQRRDRAAGENHQPGF